MKKAFCNFFKTKVTTDETLKTQTRISKLVSTIKQNNEETKVCMQELKALLGNETMSDEELMNILNSMK